MIKPAFDIGIGEQEQLAFVDSSLLLELSEKQISCLRVNKADRRLIQLKQYHLSAHSEESVTDILNELVDGSDSLFTDPKDTIVIYNFPDSALLPESSFSVDSSKMINEFVSGNAHKGLVLSDKIHGWDIYNIYRVPRELHSLVQRKFASGRYWHFYSLMLSGIISPEKSKPDFCLYVFFYPDKFVVAASSGNQLYIVQTFQYQVPEDVVYYLLKIAQQFDKDPSSVQLYVGGLIDTESAMCSEINRYFLNVDWLTGDTYNWKNEALGNYPLHYFSPLLQMALCV